MQYLLKVESLLNLCMHTYGRHTNVTKASPRAIKETIKPMRVTQSRMSSCES